MYIKTRRPIYLYDASHNFHDSLEPECDEYKRLRIKYLTKFTPRKPTTLVVG